VSAAIARLEREGLVRRAHRGSWLLLGPPPAPGELGEAPAAPDAVDA
jgi:hypothetical protein